MGTGSAAELRERRKFPRGQRRCLSPFFGRAGRDGPPGKGGRTAAHPLGFPGFSATVAAEPVPIFLAAVYSLKWRRAGHRNPKRKRG